MGSAINVRGKTMRDKLEEGSNSNIGAHNITDFRRL